MLCTDFWARTRFIFFPLVHSHSQLKSGARISVSNRRNSCTAIISSCTHLALHSVLPSTRKRVLTNTHIHTKLATCARKLAPCLGSISNAELLALITPVVVFSFSKTSLTEKVLINLDKEKRTNWVASASQTNREKKRERERGCNKETKKGKSDLEKGEGASLALLGSCHVLSGGRVVVEYWSKSMNFILPPIKMSTGWTYCSSCGKFIFNLFGYQQESRAGKRKEKWPLTRWNAAHRAPAQMTTENIKVGTFSSAGPFIRPLFTLIIIISSSMSLLHS